MKRYWFFLGLSIALAAVTVASTLYLPLLIGDAVDCLFGTGKVDFEGIFRSSKEWASSSRLPPWPNG